MFLLWAIVGALIGVLLMCAISPFIDDSDGE